MKRFHLIIYINSMCRSCSDVFIHFFCAALNGDSEGTKTRCPQEGSDEPKMIPKARAHRNEPFHE